VLGGLIAYDSAQGVIGFLLVAFGIGLYLFFHNLSDERRLRLILAVLPLVVTVAFLIAGDWSRVVAKLPGLSSAFGLLASLQPNLGFVINSNTVGGVLAMLIPLQVGALRGRRRAIQGVSMGISLLGLGLSASRGAWLALILTAAMALVWRETVRRNSSQRKAHAIWLAVVGLAALMLVMGLGLTPIGDRLLGLGGDRPVIWKNSVDLLGDYAMTGFGFGTFEMAYSTYTLLTHVGHTLHAHNLWLNVWFDQGLLGVLALTGLTLSAVWPRTNISSWRLVSLAAISVVLIHGLYDDAFYGYGGAAIPLLLMPIGLATRTSARQTEATSEFLPNRRVHPAIVMWSVSILVGAALALTSQGRAAIEANLGAVSQTRAELSVYHWPEIPVQDILRVVDGVDLSPAVEQFNKAIALDSMNTTANRRLGQIALARKDYNAACTHLQRAYSASPDQRATRQLQGECYALEGDWDQTTRLWGSIDLSQSQLVGRLWWYDTYLAAPDQARQIKHAAELLNIEP